MSKFCSFSKLGKKINSLSENFWCFMRFRCSIRYHVSFCFSRRLNSFFVHLGGKTCLFFVRISWIFFGIFFFDYVRSCFWFFMKSLCVCGAKIHGVFSSVCFDVNEIHRLRYEESSSSLFDDMRSKRTTAETKRRTSHRSRHLRARVEIWQFQHGLRRILCLRWRAFLRRP